MKCESVLELGRVVATPGVICAADEEAKELGAEPDTFRLMLFSTLLDMHRTGEWGELDAEDKEENEIAIRYGLRVFSSYPILSNGRQKIYVITEASRDITTILLPEEY